MLRGKLFRLVVGVLAFSGFLCNHDYVFINSSSNLSFGAGECMTYSQLIYNLRAENLSSMKMMLTVITDDKNDTDLDSFIQNKNVIEELFFKKDSRDLYFQFYSFNQASEQQVSDFFTNLSLLKTNSMVNTTNIIENFGQTFRALKTEIQGNIDKGVPFISLLYLHSVKSIDRLFEGGVIVGGEFPNFRDLT